MFRPLALLAAAFLMGIGFGQITESTIKSKCASEWPGDFEMQAYCERNQRQAVTELQQLTATRGGIPEEAFKTALAGCVRDWPDDYEMQAYCLRNQIEGYNTVARGPSSPPVSLTQQETATIAQHCASEWPGDYEMQAYCEGQQADGAAFLRVRPEAIPQGTWNGALRACERDWPSDFGMQAYCVRQLFN